MSLFLGWCRPIRIGVNKRGGSLVFGANNLIDTVLPLSYLSWMGFFSHKTIGEVGISQNSLEVVRGEDFLDYGLVKGSGFLNGSFPCFGRRPVERVPPPVVQVFRCVF